ncbi:MAG: hypothetical protein ACT4PL_05015 [Phycisphaerales bacterium]
MPLRSCLIIALLATPAIAQTAPADPKNPGTNQPPATKAPEPAPAATPAAPAAELDALGGPKVVEKQKPLTLIERDMAGKIKRLEQQPAEAAVRLLKLTPEIRAKVDRLLADHASAMDQLVRDNLKTIVALGGARAAGQVDDARNHLRELMAAAGPLKDRGRLQSQLTTVLSETDRSEVRRLTNEYFTAVVKEKTDEAGGESRVNMRELLFAEFAAFIGVEVSRAYERVVGQRTKDFDALLKTLNLSPEQEGKVRKVVGDSFTANYGKATPAEQARVFSEVYAILTPDQRQTLAKSFK